MTKNKTTGALIPGHGIAYSLKEVNELVRTIFHGMNVMVENVLRQGKWLLLVAFMLFTVPYVLEENRLERITAVIENLVNTFYENQRLMVKEEAKAQKDIKQITRHMDLERLLSLQYNRIIELQTQMALLARHGIEEKPAAETNLQPATSVEPDYCADPGRRHYAFTDGCDYGM
ncbi:MULTISPECIES: hypothetical protein [unclassified Ketobacter]|uniref:hypothetical protein n=1 Tax=unclassified Ketobacter TaxID=2639109 RepID=UPI0025C5F6C6|nr:MULTISPECIES: hypothetical protein [unclassified Ketobacter]MCK5790414.1 hypothetical protein [Ketobacter sp.]